MIDPDVRRATEDDADAVALLDREARAAVADSRGGARWLDEHAAVGDWTARIASGGVFVALVTVEGAEVPIGYLAASVRNDALPIVFVESVFVHPDARENGFGDALLAAAAEFGRQSNAELIEAHTLPGDREIKNLYERAGVTARLITVSKRL